jgi:hypothetical protein
MKPLRFTVYLSVIVVLVIGLGGSSATAQNNCTPFSGVVYGALYRDAVGQPRYWHLWGDFTIGREVHSATMAVKSTSLVNDGDTWQGTETWTFDFGGANTIQLMTSFVTEHMTNAAGIYHIREVGTFGNGTGAFVNAYGNLAADGPFGPSVVLHNLPTFPTVPAMFYLAPSLGTICGMNNRGQ